MTLRNNRHPYCAGGFISLHEEKIPHTREHEGFNLGFDEV
jgi:hypothetical protein